MRAWQTNPFRGNRALRKQIFMREIPIALSLAVSELGAKIDHLLEEEPLEHRHVQAWLEQVQAAQSVSETTLATSVLEFKINFAAQEERHVARRVRRAPRVLAHSPRTARGGKGADAAGHVRAVPVRRVPQRRGSQAFALPRPRPAPPDALMQR